MRMRIDEFNKLDESLNDTFEWAIDDAKLPSYVLQQYTFSVGSIEYAVRFCKPAYFLGVKTNKCSYVFVGKKVGKQVASKIKGIANIKKFFATVIAINAHYTLENEDWSKTPWARGLIVRFDVDFFEKYSKLIKMVLRIKFKKIFAFAEDFNYTPHADAKCLYIWRKQLSFKQIFQPFVDASVDSNAKDVDDALIQTGVVADPEEGQGDPNPVVQQTPPVQQVATPTIKPVAVKQTNQVIAIDEKKMWSNGSSFVRYKGGQRITFVNNSFTLKPVKGVMDNLDSSFQEVDLNSMIDSHLFVGKSSNTKDKNLLSYPFKEIPEGALYYFVALSKVHKGSKLDSFVYDTKFASTVINGKGNYTFFPVVRKTPAQQTVKLSGDLKRATVFDYNAPEPEGLEIASYQLSISGNFADYGDLFQPLLGLEDLVISAPIGDEPAKGLTSWEINNPQKKPTTQFIKVDDPTKIWRNGEHYFRFKDGIEYGNSYGSFIGGNKLPSGVIESGELEVNIDCKELNLESLIKSRVFVGYKALEGDNYVRRYIFNISKNPKVPSYQAVDFDFSAGTILSGPLNNYEDLLRYGDDDEFVYLPIGKKKPVVEVLLLSMDGKRATVYPVDSVPSVEGDILRLEFGEKFDDHWGPFKVLFGKPDLTEDDLTKKI